MSKKIKEMELNALRKKFLGVKDYVFIEPAKVDAATDYAFRKSLRSKKVHCQLVKNTLAKRALKGTSFEVLEKHFAGTTAVAYTGQADI